MPAEAPVTRAVPWVSLGAKDDMADLVVSERREN
jgi:hypothetical protein